jgi:hypothetical protein
MIELQIRRPCRVPERQSGQRYCSDCGAEYAELSWTIEHKAVIEWRPFHQVLAEVQAEGWAR